MIDPKLIHLLRCPIDGSKLILAENSLVHRVNEAILRGEVRDRGDQRITRSIDDGLLNADSSRLYPVRGGIPTLVGDAAIELASQSGLRSP